MDLEKILISACLLGEPLRYDGRGASRISPLLQRWQKERRLVAVCPEVAGGLPVPRPPAEIQGGSGGDVLRGRAKVVRHDGGDVSAAFVSGAKAALALCVEHGIRVAILTESSPACGSSQVHDGDFQGCKQPGEGVTTALLRRNGIQVFNQHQLEEVAALLER